jgi:hypothetical protein
MVFNLVWKRSNIYQFSKLFVKRQNYRCAPRSVDPFVGIGAQYHIGQLALRADFDLLAVRLLHALAGKPSNRGWVETRSVGVVWRCC